MSNAMASRPVFVIATVNSAAGRLELSASSGIIGLYAVTRTSAGKLSSARSMWQSGNDPVKTQERKWGKPHIVVPAGPKP